MLAENVDMREPLSVDELSTKVLKLELLLNQANKERAISCVLHVTMLSVMTPKVSNAPYGHSVDLARQA